MRKLNRRAAVGLAGIAGLGSLVGGRTQADTAAPNPWAALPARDGTLHFTVDVALLGHSDAQNTAGRIGDPHAFLDTDARGDTFYVEGILYPGGTIHKPTQPTGMPAFPDAPPKLNNEVVWDFNARPPLGHWFCRGWVLFNGNPKPYVDSKGTVIEIARMQPRLLSDQTFVFGRLDGAHLSPEMLVTSGTENGMDVDADKVTRAVTGGTGRFAHVRGEVVQERIGRNTSTLRSLSKVGVGAPNFRFSFDLKVG